MGASALSNPGADLELRDVDLADAPRLYEWRNDPTTVATSLSRRRVEPAEHEAWLASRLTDDGWRGYIAAGPGGPVALARFALDDSGRWRIGIVVAPEERGKGLASVVITAACRRLVRDTGAEVEVVAHVRSANRASIASFQRAGFRIVAGAGAADGDVTVYGLTVRLGDALPGV